MLLPFDPAALGGVLPSPSALAVATLALVAAYAIFTLVGFGSAMIAATPLAAVLPVARIVPLLALLDCVGASVRGWRARRRIDRGELARLLPGMAAGQVVGVTLLAGLPANALAVALGLFVALYGLWGLRGGGGTAPAKPLAATWAVPCGLAGGLLGALFGSGGFLYAAYLGRRLPDRDAFRATQAVLMALSTGLRVVLCALAGLIDGPLLLLALCAAPAMVLGVALGGHLDLRLSRERFTRALNLALLAAGAALLAKVGWAA
ncbi:TSUP family transporter [Oryzomicrobium sp.]|uniref:TSUP family transporter n=1 Tax=Oryzomicrobium sp. TaxID=1911578 RepID=UPI0025FAA902|nr:TSUP family transporter [Oryzomicrobium sp.]MCE1244169.1 sulfite exporter TauE/SafE family protein [Oryzomicrobium sp.]